MRGKPRQAAADAPVHHTPLAILTDRAGRGAGGTRREKAALYQLATAFMSNTLMERSPSSK